MSLLERFLQPKIERVDARDIVIPGRISAEVKRPYVIASIMIGEKRIPTPFLIDTGAAVSVIMPADQERLGIVFDERQALSEIGFSDLPSIRCMERNFRLRFSGFSLNREASRKKALIHIQTVVNFYITEPRPNYISLLGMDVLSRFTLTYSSSSLTLETDGNPDPKLDAYRVGRRYFR